MIVFFIEEVFFLIPPSKYGLESNFWCWSQTTVLLRGLIDLMIGQLVWMFAWLSTNDQLNVKSKSCLQSASSMPHENNLLCSSVIILNATHDWCFLSWFEKSTIPKSNDITFLVDDKSMTDMVFDLIRQKSCQNLCFCFLASDLVDLKGRGDHQWLAPTRAFYVFSVQLRPELFTCWFFTSLFCLDHFHCFTFSLVPWVWLVLY